MFLKCLGFCHWKHTSSTQKKYPTVIQEFCQQFSLAEIKKLTNNFAENRVLGSAAFGKVYKGCLQRNDGSDYAVAVRRYDAEFSVMFRKEVELLCQLHHPNCVSLIGFCDEKNENIVVYEYMSNGSLCKQLQGGDSEALSWKKRLEICIGAARGLHYLHAGTKRTIIHRNITVNSIHLDDDMESKLAGFSICVLGPRFTSKDSKPKPIKVDPEFIWGTAGYMAMEHLRDGTISDKYDVYSFGVVLLEVVCGCNYLRMPMKHLEKCVEENIDPNIKGMIAPECWQVFIELTQRCVKYEPDERPTMGEVEVELEHALSLQEQADITNTNGEYTLLPTSIIHLGLEPDAEHNDNK